MKSALSRRGPRALRRGHTPRGFPSGTSGSGCLLFRCHAGPPRQLPGGRLSARRGGGGSPGLASRRAPPGPGCKPAPGFLPQTETQVSRRRCAEAAGCGSRARTANLHRHPGSFSSSREDLKKPQKFKKKKNYSWLFWPGFFPEGLRAVIFRPRIRGRALPALPASSGLVAGCPPGSRGGGNRARPFPAVLSVRARQKLPSEPDPSGRGLVPRLNRRARGEGKRALPAEQPGPGQRCRRLGRPRPPQRPSAGSRSRPGPRPRGVGSAGGAGVGDWDRLEMHAGGSDRSSPLFPSSKTGAAEEGEFPAVPLAWIRGSLRWEPSSPSALRPWLRGPSPLRPPQGGSAAGRPR